jgi:hypothetical protein
MGLGFSVLQIVTQAAWPKQLGRVQQAKRGQPNDFWKREEIPSLEVSLPDQEGSRR